MRKTAPRLAKTEAYIEVEDLANHAQGWLLDGEVRQLSKRTSEARRDLIDKLLWFLHREGARECGLREVRAFLAHVSRGHEEPDGRWGSPANRKPVRPRTVHTYFTNLKTLFQFLVDEEALEASPMAGLRPPVVRADQIEPFTDGQIRALLTAAKGSRNPRRDTGILLLLLDGGLRASELCLLTVGDVDFTERTCVVLGKGNKRRVVPFGTAVARALFAHLRGDPKYDDEFVFTSDRGTRCGEPLTRSGLLQLVKRLGRAAGVSDAYPHRFRHTCAISFLRNGGNPFALQRLLGHTNLAMTRRYSAIAEADVINQHRRYSPADRLALGTHAGRRARQSAPTLLAQRTRKEIP